LGGANAAPFPNLKDHPMTNRPPGRAYEHVQRKLTEQERTALRESLAAHGLREAITIDQHGDIIDGYNREALCGELGIPVAYRTLEVADPVHWIRHNQTARRNLSEAEMRDLIMETKTQNPEASVRIIAEKLGTSKTTVARALSNSTVPHGTVNRVKGKDGKVRTYTPKPKAEAEADPDTKVRTPKQRGLSPQVEKALHVYDRRKLAGESLSYDAMEAEAGVSSSAFSRAIAIRQAEEAVVKQAEIILSASAQEKFDAKVRAFEKNFDLKVETLGRELFNKWKEGAIQGYFDELRKVESLINNPRWAIMPLAHYKKIVACLHPDNARPGHEDRFNEAFVLFNDYKPKLVDLSSEKDEKARLKRIELRGNPLPRTVEEMLARKTMKRK
jgi:hypothetical protein